MAVPVLVTQGSAKAAETPAAILSSNKCTNVPSTTEILEFIWLQLKPHESLMHGACRLSRRWHQQFCRSPSYGGHQQCLQNLQPVREYRQLTKSRVSRMPVSQIQQNGRNPLGRMAPPQSSGIVVREFEPDPYDQSKLNRIEPNQEVSEEMEHARTELLKLEQELSVMKQGPFGPQSKFMQSLPKDEREQLLQALANEGILQGEHEDLLTMAELERLAEEDDETQHAGSRGVGVTLKIPKKDQAYARHFNQALRAADEANGHDVQKNLNLWRWYLRCQQQVYNFSNIISEEVWSLLWTSQAELTVRPKHLVMLANDMLEAKVTLDSHQWFLYIKCLHACNDTLRAIEVWQRQKTNITHDTEFVKRFWEMGIQMYAAVGQPLKAQELAFNALQVGKADPQVLVYVITTWAKSRTPEALVKGWACYIKLREKTGDAMLPELYERISNAFLDADCGDMALGVFKDMLLMKEISSYDSNEVYKKATKHFSDVLHNATTEEQINRVGLSALLILPKQFQNRFFFTSWIKRLIGEKRIDSASTVVELMYERGIAPDAKPLNGIVGAWLREGSVSAQQKAENLAWSMIETRAQAVARRNATSSEEGKEYRTIVLDNRAQSLQRRVPAATIETFSILLQHYTRRRDVMQAEKLTNTMIESCQIQPNSYIMNHWLFGDLRAGRLQAVWDKYCNLKRDIRPDLETFAALWDTAKVQFSKTDSAYAKDFPSARELFAEMKSWISSLTHFKSVQVKQDFSTELYEQIVRCFCLSTDLPGTLLAMHHMVRLFDMYPTDNALRLVCGQAARLLPQDRSGTKLSRTRRSSARQKTVISQVADILETIETEKKLNLVDKGVDAEAIEDPETEVSQELRLAVLTDFICLFMQKAQAETGSYRNDIKIAAQTMQVEVEGIDLQVPN